jgi:hypothetical protein
MRNAILAVTVLSISVPAFAAEPQGEREQRVSAIDLERFDTAYTIEQTRGAKTKNGVFYADPQLIDEEKIIVFQISSISPERSLERWKCVAIHDVAECLGRAVRVPYLAGEKKLVMTVTAVRKATAEGQALIAEAKKRDQRLVLLAGR